jgi:hypothetical protein
LAFAWLLLCVANSAPSTADEISDGGVVPAAAVQPATATPAEDAAIEEAAAESQPESTGAKPTHKQSALINVNADGLQTASVQCFCLASDDRLLAACSGPANEIRVFTPDGKFVEAFKLPVAPEAINVAPDGTILVAGDGKLLRLSAEGGELLSVDSPHAEAMNHDKAKIREQVIAEHKQQFAIMPQMLEAYNEAIKTVEQQLKDLGDGEDAATERAAYEQTLEAYRSAKEQIEKQYGDQKEPTELTEEQIDELVAASVKYKTKVASISATKDNVFIACNAPVGYGYDVWRMNAEFADGDKIVSGLSGCCGQMDVQASADGVFVAENSRHRVCRYDDDGELVCTWGKGASEGVEGFASCCNPMNLAFGKGGVVYTAEDTTGRIKRYKPDGTLLSVVGAADVVPGCKKVSIGVDSTGDRVYMLDITRNHIAVLSRVLPDPTEPITDADAPSSGGIGGGILRLLGIGG